jgi:hypothetical protein
MTKYVLEITKPDERYCDGCSLNEDYYSGHICYITRQWLQDKPSSQLNIITPPNCPLKKVEEK